MGSTYLADILRIHASRLRNLYVMDVKISEIFKLTSKGGIYLGFVRNCSFGVVGSNLTLGNNFFFFFSHSK